MAKLSKAQIDELAGKLSTPWGRVDLLCDTHRITLKVQRDKGFTSRVVTYVDGYFKGQWILSEQEHPEQKFLHKVSQKFYGPKKMALMIKAFGKRDAEKMNKTMVFYRPDWANGKRALNHLNKVCESIELAPEQEAA